MSSHTEEYAQDYTLQELLVVAAAREVKDGEVAFIGVGIPCMGALVAKLTHAPNVILAVESGCIGPTPYRLMLGIGDNACGENAICVTSLWRAFSDQQRGYFDLGMLGGAQVDKYGNLNSTTIFGDGDYFNPKTRLPGSGGANDIAISAKRTLIMMNQQKRRFLENVDFITSPGYLDGPGPENATDTRATAPPSLFPTWPYSGSMNRPKRPISIPSIRESPPRTFANKSHGT